MLAHFFSTNDFRTQVKFVAWWQWAILTSIIGIGWVVTFRTLATPEAIGTLAGFVLVALSLTCTYTDLTRFRIPNWATYGLTGGSFVFNGLASLLIGQIDLMQVENSNSSLPVMIEPLGAIGIGPALLGAASCFGAMLVVYLICHSGAGDVKLAMAIGSVMGMDRGLEVIIWCYFLGGLFVLCRLIWEIGPVGIITITLRYIAMGLSRTVLGKWYLPHWGMLTAPVDTSFLRRKLPLAPFFGVATILVLLGVSWK